MKPSASSLSRREGRSRNFAIFFLQAFSDVLLDKVAPANVKFQRYADNFEEYADLNNDERLDEDEIKLLALVSKREKQANVDSPLGGGEEGGGVTSVRNWA